MIITKKATEKSVTYTKKLTYIISQRSKDMNEIAELIEAKIDVMLTNIIANKLDFLDRDKQFSPLMTQDETRKWLKIGNDTLQYYIDKGMPVIKKTIKFIAFHGMP